MGGNLKAWPDNARTLDEILIGDGYVYRGYVAAQPRQHGALQYAFRPMLSDQVDAIDARLAELQASRRPENVEKASRIVRETIAKQVVWNSITEGALSPEEIRQLPYQVYNRMYLQISGQVPMDEGYEKDPDETTASDQLEADVKN